MFPSSLHKFPTIARELSEWFQIMAGKRHVVNHRVTAKYRTYSSLLAPVVQRPDNFIRWIRHYSGSKTYFTLNVVQGFRTLLN